MNSQKIVVFLAALFVIPALGDSLREALNKIPDARTFLTTVVKDSAAEENMVGSGQKAVTLFVPSNKAMLEHQKSTGQIFRRAPSQSGEDRSTYHTSNDKYMIRDLKFQELVLTTRNVDSQTGKPNDIVTAPGGKSGPGRPLLRARTTDDDRNATLYSGLGTDSRVIAGDYPFDRGVIHIIDTVLDVPQRCSETLRYLNYNNFQAALNRSGLGAAIDKPGVTVLAYSNEVFTSTASPGANLRQNIIEGFIGYSPKLAGKDSFTTVDNKTLAISFKDGTYYVNESPIIKSDIICSNGVIHSLGKLLAPDIAPYVPGSAAAPAFPPTARVAAITCALVTAVLHLIL